MNDLVKTEHAPKEFREIDETYKPDLDRIDEARVQKWWREKHFFDTNMEAIDRRVIRVLKPGIWNHNEGPDFMHAEIEIDGKLHVGDVEIHVDLQSGTHINTISIPDTIALLCMRCFLMTTSIYGRGFRMENVFQP